jgi:hypothetical protein
MATWIMAMKKEQYEVRRNEDGTVDEIVSENVKFLHVEQMDNGHWWIGITLKNKKRLMLNFTSGRKIKASVEED